MALPTAWELLLPNFNVTTVIGIVLLILAFVGGPIFRFVGRILSILTRQKVNNNIIVSLLLVAGVILIWGVSIVQDIFNSIEGVLITAFILFAIAIFIISYKRIQQ